MAQDLPQPTENVDTPRGFAFALTAYGLWGFLPLYMKAVVHIPAPEVIAHRILWSLPIAGLVLLWLGRTADVKMALRTPRVLGMACVTAALITVNWGIYFWSIAAGRALDTALGYFINPLFSILLGAVLLNEKLSRMQMGAIAIATLAVAILTYENGSLPWASLALTVTWSFYAYLRKTLPVGPNQGFFLEVLILSVPAFIYIAYIEGSGNGHLLSSTWYDTIILSCAGLATAVPLMIYANGAKLLRLSTIGIMQYIAPTMIFLIAVFVFKEPFGTARMIAFPLIWLALVLYTVPMVRQYRQKEKQVEAA